MLLAWERRPECGAQWFLLVVFLAKEAGGFQAIGPLLAFWAWLWSRLRQPACRLWERPLGDVFSWGHGQTTARDRSAHVRRAQHGVGLGSSAGSGERRGFPRPQNVL